MATRKSQRLDRPVARAGFDKLAVALDSRAAWTDLVLPPRELKALRQIAADAREPIADNGLFILFAGAGGTGKTLAAEVLANELRRPLYRIDLSKVASKYIGETEKNLDLLFDKAEADDALLLIDEADALFGRRSEVKDSHDRYANLEVGYLLQRMESYRGITILETNNRSAVDPAVLRRSKYVVDFELSDPAQGLNATPTTVGYSGRSLAEKLGMKPESRVVALNAPPEYRSLLEPLPQGLMFEERPGKTTDLVHLFVIDWAALAAALAGLRRTLRPETPVWVSWPKKSSKVPTTITEDVIREVALPLGFVDIKVCAVSAVWSGLKLVVRKELR